MEGELARLAVKWGVNVCGEGGEYETFTMDCPIFRQKLVAKEKKVVIHSQDAFAPVCLLVQLLETEEKDSWYSESTHREMVGRVLDGGKSLLERFDPLHYCHPFHEAENIPGLCEVEMEELDLANTKPAYSEDDGWYSASFVRGEGMDEGESVDRAFAHLASMLAVQATSLREVVKVIMYVDTMDSYLAMNCAYQKQFSLNPPVRVCVALGRDKLPQGCRLVLSVVGRKGGERKVLHVQGWSHWAPANIGPYSQGVLTSGRMFVSGMIGLVPGTMSMLGEIEAGQAGLAIRHVERVAKVVAGLAIRDTLTVNCYVLDMDGAKQANEIWKNQCDEEVVTPVVSFIQVSELPRQAKVEWEVVLEGNWQGLEEDL